MPPAKLLGRWKCLLVSVVYSPLFLTQEKGGFVRYVVVDVLLLLLINHMVPHVINPIRGNKGVRKSQPNSGKNSIIV